MSSQQPELMTLTVEETEAFKSRIANSPLLESDKKMVLGLLSFTLWLQQQLSLAKLGIKRLKSLFGVSTEKKTLKNHPLK
jgi:hypothetical protein